MTAPRSFLPNPARIRSIVVESEDTRSFVLRLETAAPELDAATPGQFVMLSLLGYGEAAFTLSHLPSCGAEPGTVTITVRRIGVLTQAFFALDRGGRVGVRGPFGRGFPVTDVDRPTVYAGGGCGLVPLKSAIDDQIARRAAGTPVAIVYGASTPATRILRAALAAWRRTPGVMVLESVEVAADGWQGRVGGVVELVEEAVRAAGAERAAVCGPPAMLPVVTGRLIHAGLAPESVHVALERYMKCGTGLCGHCYVNDRYLCTDGPVFSLAEIATLPEAFGADAGDAGAYACV